MTWGYAASVAVAAGIIGASGTGPALAAESRCPSLSVITTAGVRARWPELPGRVQEALALRHDVDTCARVELSVNGDAIAIAVVLPDGRSAARPVAGQEDVIPVLEALLVVPEQEEPAPEAQRAPDASLAPAARLASESRKAAPPELTARPSLAISEPGARTGPSFLEPTRLRIELSVSAGVRFGDGEAGYGLGSLSLLDVAGWLGGFAGRWDRYQRIGAGGQAGGLELAALAGRRFKFSSVFFDLIAGGGAAIQGTSTIVTQSTSTGSTVTQSSSRSVLPRLILGTRLGLRPRSVLRAFVGFDAEFGPDGPAASGDPSKPAQLPPWAMGFVAGATVGTL